MLLSNTTDKLSLITDQAGDIDVVVTYIDRNQTTGAIGAADRQLTNITTATTTDILAAPAATTDRKVLDISIRNAHASTSNDVVVQYNANSILYELHAARLYATERLEWSEDKGFVITSRLNKPHFDTRMSDVSTNTDHNATQGSDSVVAGCLTLVKPQAPGALARRLATFSSFTGIGQATTTGIAFGGVETRFSPTIGRTTHLASVTASVTAAVLAAISTNYSGSTFVPLAVGTSTIANNLLTLSSTIMTWTAATSDIAFSLRGALASEVNASLATIDKGACFCSFEFTD